MFLFPCLISKESDAFRPSCFHCPMYKPVLSSHPREAQKLAAYGKWLLSGGEYQYRNMVRPKLKLSLFALYRPTRKYPADSKDFIGIKVLLFFLLVTTVRRITFIVYLPRKLQKSCKKLGNQCYF